MIRVLIPLLLFLLPFAIYGMLIMLDRVRAKARGQAPNMGRTINYGVATVSGLLLAALSIAIFGTVVSKDDANRYVPPTLSADGQLTPGRLVVEPTEDGTEPAN